MGKVSRERGTDEDEENAKRTREECAMGNRQ
jgi:hypothetical protein